MHGDRCARSGHAVRKIRNRVADDRGTAAVVRVAAEVAIGERQRNAVRHVRIRLRAVDRVAADVQPSDIRAECSSGVCGGGGQADASCGGSDRRQVDAGVVVDGHAADSAQRRVGGGDRQVSEAQVVIDSQIADRRACEVVSDG